MWKVSRDELMKLVEQLRKEGFHKEADEIEAAFTDSEAPGDSRPVRLEAKLMNRFPSLLAVVLSLAFGFGCATAPVPIALNPDGSTNTTVVVISPKSATPKAAAVLDAIKKVDQSANAFLQNPLVQVGSRPAGQLLGFSGMLAYALAGGDPQPFADQISYWCKLVYTAAGSGNVTPEMVDAVGITFSASLNSTDKKFAAAFGPIQQRVRAIAGQPGVSRQTVIDFIGGLGEGAAVFGTQRPS